ncbi:hypothetical protein [Leptolyngbya sp. FACHB-261]|uniref:hypothetical protein n=1 Tax=Leptolyngbya sp. FACHB-261 TaxID=2692806 RepID=UPI0016825C3C|nr:hypothetical protein [Leptolyngbya sp. FACHB-261]MBD2103939.1 hypothetical protein [Leptolyngbya sp. FACHB-261]
MANSSAKSSKRPFFIEPRTLIACFGALPACFAVYTCLYMFAVPYLLNSRSVVITYTGFYIQFPTLIGEVHNLRCQTSGAVVDGYEYFCRFNAEPSSIEQFVKEMKFTAGEYECGDLEQYPQEQWWKPTDIAGGQCYLNSPAGHPILLYSPISQLAYIKDADYSIDHTDD